MAISGAGAPAATEENWAPIEAPEYRIRVANISEKKAAWGAYIEFSGAICPLTPLENRLRALAGEAGYAQGFVEHYLLPLIYPQALTHGIQLALGAAVVAINALLYALWLHSRRP